MGPLVALLSGGKAHSSVTSFIMDMIEKFVVEADYGTEDGSEGQEMVQEPVYITPNFCVQLEQSHVAEMNLGSKILIPHVLMVLNYIRKSIAHGLNARDLNVLMRISEFVTDGDQSSELIRLVVPALRAIANRSSNPSNSSAEETMTQYLHTLANLLQNAHGPNKFLRYCLFS